MHVLDPNAEPTLLQKVMADLRKSERDDGTLDIPTLVSSPLLSSMFTETIRLYVDALVTRSASQDTTLPLDEDGKRFVKLRKGENVFAPSWIGAHSTESWSSANEFHAERYLAPDPENPSQQVFVAPKGNLLFPFGGGVTICPGRVFAKQEALGAFAMVLLRFDVEVVGNVDKDGEEAAEMPGFANAFPGSGGLVPGGDMKVKITRRSSMDR